MKRVHLIAAEIWGYSFHHYLEKLRMRHVRFARFMPAMVHQIEQAVQENRPDERLAKALDVPVKEARSLRQAYKHAVEIVDAPDSAEAFRRGVRDSIWRKFRDRAGDGEIEELVVQICYRAADLGFLLDQERRKLSSYSNTLRQEHLAGETECLDG